jgi:hypothetical protein
VAGWASSRSEDQQGPQAGGVSVELSVIPAPHRHVQPHPEQPPLPPGQAGGEVGGVGGRRLHLGIDQASPLRVKEPGGLQARPLAPEPLRSHRWCDGLDVQGHLGSPWEGEEGLEPPGPHLPGIAGDGEAAADLLAHPQRARPYLQGVRAEQYERNGAPR